MAKNEGVRPKGDSQNRILTYMRVRPPNSSELQSFNAGQQAPILTDEDQTPDSQRRIIIKTSGKAYEFDGVFWYKVTQRDIFKTCAVPTLENVFAGYCGAVMAYGQTGTGKTHTMQGYEGEPGIIPRSAEYIFNRIRQDPAHNYKVTVSFVQIYLDKLQDLFAPNNSEVQIDPEKERVSLPGITVYDCRDESDFMSKFHAGEKHRVTRKTKMNDTSSRGHAAMIVNITSSSKGTDDVSHSKIGKLVLIDLAGYERFTLTGIEGGIAQQEAKKINASLLALGSVVNALADRDKHVPFRNAKLTRLLKDCLGGTAKTSIILTIGPSDKYRQETSGTLYFGWRAMAVKVQAQVMTVSDPTQFMAMMKDKLEKAQERIQTMAAWWSRSHPNDFQKYCQKYGNVDCDLASDFDMSMPVGAAPVGVGGGLAAAELLADDGEPAHGAVAEVRQQFKEEVVSTNEAHNRELAALRQHHQEELAAARKHGADPRQLEEMRKQNQEELAMMENQYGEHMRALLEEKSKQEMAVLLQEAQRSLGNQSRDRERRLKDMTEHLLNTCESKNDMLGRLFELVCHYEEQMKSQDQAMAGFNKVQGEWLTEERGAWQRREEEYRTQIFLLREQIQEIRGGRPSSKTGAAPAPSSGTSSSSRPSGAGTASRSGGGGDWQPPPTVPPGSLGSRAPMPAPLPDSGKDKDKKEKKHRRPLPF